MVATAWQRMRKGRQQNQQHKGQAIRLWGTTMGVEPRPQIFYQPLWSLWAYLSPGMALLSLTSRSIKSWKIFSLFGNLGPDCIFPSPAQRGPPRPLAWEDATYFWGIIRAAGGQARIRILANFQIPTRSSPAPIQLQPWMQFLENRFQIDILTHFIVILSLISYQLLVTQSL